MATLSEKQAKAITAIALGAAMAPELVVTIRDRRTGNCRFAQGQPTTEGDVETLEIAVTASVQGRSATAVGNRSDKASIQALVAEAEELAVLSPIDPEHMPPLAAARTLAVAGHDPATAKLGASERAKSVAQALAVAREQAVEIAGYLEHHEDSFAVANSTGLFAWWPSTEASLTLTCRTADASGSGWAGAVGHQAKRLDAEALAHTAGEKADMSREPEVLEPGKRLVVLEAQAVADLLGFFVGALDARAADEGRSAFSHPDGGSRVGEQLFDPRVVIRSNPAEPDHPAQPFSGEGEPQRMVEWVESGVLRSLVCSRYWADKTNQKSTPRPSSIHMRGEDVDLIDLVRAIDSPAVLVTRFFYNRMLEPRTIMATGLTRDGTFLVDKGRITKALKNFRYNESPLTLLKNVVAFGRPQRVISGGTVMVVPPLVVKDFNFASLSDAV
ncbi:TldD/PmbA family protein [Nannocystaceae bacterium ST9]